LDSERAPRTLELGPDTYQSPIVVTTLSMFNEGRETSMNPILIRFDSGGQVNAVRRLVLVVGTADDVEKKFPEVEPDDEMLIKLNGKVQGKKLDLRKAADRASLIQEIVEVYGADKARVIGVQIYDGNWKLRYRWPAKASKTPRKG
jgi:hypothetical protein